MRPSLAFGFVVFAGAIAVAALFFVFGTFSPDSPYFLGFTAAAVGGLFILAAILISGSLRLGALSELQDLAAHYGLERSGSVETLRRRITLHLLRERSGEGQSGRAQLAGGRDLTGVPTTPATSFSAGVLGSFNREVPQELVKEGKYLLALARLFNVEVRPYKRILARAHKAAQEGRYDDWMQAMRVGNERLRALLEETPSEEP